MSYMIGVAVPSRTAAGRYQIDLLVRSGNERAVAHAWIDVPEQRELSLSILESPELVISGTELKGRFLLSNRGNSRASVRVRLRTARFHMADTSIVELAAGESLELPVRFQTSPTIRSAVESITAVSVETVGHPGVRATSSFRTMVAPAESYAPAPIHTIGSSIRLIGASSTVAGSGLEISGAGLLTDASSARVEYLARRINGAGAVFGDRDAYRIAVELPWLSVSAGDEVSRISPLTESGRYARGAKVEARSNGWTVGGFINRETGLITRRSESAAFLNRDFGEGIFFGATYLDRSGPSGGRLVSARGSLSSLPIGTVDAEIGHSVNGKRAEAWAVNASGNFDRVGYSINRHKTDRDYPGSTRGSEMTGASVHIEAARGVRIRASANDFRTERRLPRSPTGSSHHWNRLGGISFGRLLAVEAIQTGRADPGLRADPIREEQLASARISSRAGRVSLNGSAGFGTARSESRTRGVARYSAQASLAPRKNANVSVRVEYLRGGTLSVPDEKSEERLSLGAMVPTRFGSFSVNGYASRHRLAKRNDDVNIDASWETDLPNGHKVSIRARLHRNPFFESPEDNILRAEYTIPFRMPVGLSRTRARIAGTVVREESRAPVAGAIVQLGTQVAVTDARGRFAFSVDTEDPVLLNLGGSSATAGLLPLVSLPLTLQLRRGRTGNVEIMLTRASQIDGRIRVFAPPPGFRPDDERQPVEETGEHRRVRIQASRGSEVRYILTGADGRFSFTDLRPGRWVLRIGGSELPPQSILKGDSVIVDTRRGETTTVTVDIVPRQRRIRIVSGG
jgi:hypothetical protein